MAGGADDAQPIRWTRGRAIDRRRFMTGVSAAALATAGGFARAADEATPAVQPSEPPPAPFDFSQVVALAKRRADKAHEARELQLKPPFAGLAYDAYRSIRYRRDIALFQQRDLPFSLDLLPPGNVYKRPVAILIVRDGQPTPIAFSSDYFQFAPDFGFPDGAAPPNAGEGLAFSGFRLRFPLNSPDVMDEVAVFQGASYFRAIARSLIYGLSARGLAIRTADPKGEEFPQFTSFWIYEPAPAAPNIRVQALLESPSVVGAFDFDIRPGDSTVMEIHCRLFPRQEIGQIGIAPLTSMYYFGPARRAGRDDFRDAVHDSAALQMIHGSGRRLLRSLTNPARVQVSAFEDENPKGFGLTQRRRDFGYYQDAEARYDKRPSAWIEPLGEWGRGHIMLVEIPVQDEFNDNIVAFWRPRSPLAPSEDGHAFDYRLHWCAEPPDGAPIARVLACRSGRAVNEPDRRVIVVDFKLGEIPIAELKPVLWASGGGVSQPTLKALPGGESARAAFDFEPGGAELIEFQLTLAGPAGDASETWMYQWTAP